MEDQTAQRQWVARVLKVRIKKTPTLDIAVDDDIVDLALSAKDSKTIPLIQYAAQHSRVRCI